MISVKFLLLNRQMCCQGGGLWSRNGKSSRFACQKANEAFLIMGNVIGQFSAGIGFLKIIPQQLPNGRSGNKVEVELMGFQNIKPDKISSFPSCTHTFFQKAQTIQKCPLPRLDIKCIYT